MQTISSSVHETRQIGSLIAKNLKSGAIICLCGNLGSGKTVLAKGIARGLGIKSSKVISPSFVLIREYPHAKLPLYHFDLYRLRGKADIFALGSDEYLYGSGVCVIEWAEKLQEFLPEDCLKIELSIRGKQQRLLKFTAIGKEAKKLLKAINADISH